MRNFCTLEQNISLKNDQGSRRTRVSRSFRGQTLIHITLERRNLYLSSGLPIDFVTGAQNSTAQISSQPEHPVREHVKDDQEHENPEANDRRPAWRVPV